MADPTRVQDDGGFVLELPEVSAHPTGPDRPGTAFMYFKRGEGAYVKRFGLAQETFLTSYKPDSEDAIVQGEKDIASGVAALDSSKFVLSDGVKLRERASAPAAASNVGWFYTMDDGGDTEPFYKDDKDRVCQFIKDGAVNGGAVGLGAAAADRMVFTDGAGMFSSESTLKHAAGGVVRFGDGVIGAPSMSFSGENGSGLYRAGAGQVNLSVLGGDALRASGSGVVIPGNLTVLGTTVTLNTETLDVEDRAIHVNHIDGIAPVPAALAGFSVHRGSVDGITPRDHAAMLWVSDSDVDDPSTGTGFWRFSAQTDGDDITVGADLDAQMRMLRVSRNNGIGIRFENDNLADIGADGATRPRSLFVGTSIISPTIGPSAAQQHTLPAIASDTFALLLAAQDLTSKTLITSSVTGLLTYTSGVAITAGSYQRGRDLDATNQLHDNVPTGAGFERSINDVAVETLDATSGLKVSSSAARGLWLVPIAGAEVSTTLQFRPASAGVNERYWALSAYGQQPGELTLSVGNAKGSDPYDNPTNATSVMRIDGLNKRVGIGNGPLTPSYPLDIKQASNVFLGLGNWATLGNDSGLGDHLKIGGIVAAQWTAVEIWAGNAERATFGASEIVLNDPGNDIDFRVESDTEANALFVDAALNRVACFTGTPNFDFDVAGGKRVGLGAPSSAPTDADLDNGQMSAWLDEVGNLLTIRVRYSDGTLKTGTVALV